MGHPGPRIGHSADIGRSIYTTICPTEIVALESKIKHLNDIIDFVLDKCVCKNAGSSLDNQFAYLWTRDWKEFERRVKDVRRTV